MVFRVPHNVFRQQKNVTAARLAGGKHIYIKLTKLAHLITPYEFSHITQARYDLVPSEPLLNIVRVVRAAVTLTQTVRLALTVTLTLTLGRILAPAPFLKASL